MTAPKKPTDPTTDIELSLPDQDTLATEALHEKLADAELPGFQVEFDPDEAERAGRFHDYNLTNKAL